MRGLSFSLQTYVSLFVHQTSPNPTLSPINLFVSGGLEGMGGLSIQRSIRPPPLAESRKPLAGVAEMVEDAHGKLPRAKISAGLGIRNVPLAPRTFRLPESLPRGDPHAPLSAPPKVPASLGGQRSLRIDCPSAA